jgi:hypothetical protein
MQSQFPDAPALSRRDAQAISRAAKGQASSHQSYSAPARRNGGHHAPVIPGRMTVIRKATP